MPVDDDSFQLVSAYNSGMVGYIDSPADRDAFDEYTGDPLFSAPAIKGSGKGKYAALWQYAILLDPKSFTERQDGPDCTSHGSRNARDTSRAVQVCVQRRPEAFVKRGATEPVYGARGHGGAGMSPARAAKFENEVGYLIRQKYPPIDLSEYNYAAGASWGRRGVPQIIKDLCSERKVGTVRRIGSVDDAMDVLCNGCGIQSGQNAGWAATVNSRNIHPRQGRWSHCMATLGYDSSREFWDFDVFFIQNSWGAWNSPPKEWPKYLPPWVPGMIVTSADDWEVCVASGDCYAYSDVDGFPPTNLPGYGTIGRLSL